MTPEIEKILNGLPEKVCNGILSPNEAILVLEYLGELIIDNIFEGV